MEIVAMVLVCPFVAILWHEAAHAIFALAVSRERVHFQVGFGPARGFTIGRLTVRIGPILTGGFCAYDDVPRRGDRALVAAAGPVSSVLLAALAWNLRQAGHPTDPSLALLLGQLAVASAGMALITAIPIRYPARLARGGESDGLVVLRALFPASRFVLLTVPEVDKKPQRPLRAPFAIVLAAVMVLAFFANIWLGLVTLAFFGFVYMGERHG
jgi:hypothetical protein